MPLAGVREVVQAPGEQGAALVGEYWDEVERRVAGQRELAGLLPTGLNGGDGRFGTLDVRIREVPEQPVLSERGRLELGELEPWLRATKARLAAEATGCGGIGGSS